MSEFLADAVNLFRIYLDPGTITQDAVADAIYRQCGRSLPKNVVAVQFVLSSAVASKNVTA
ncbi:hypothetical protein DEJ73_12800 [Chromohalobacter salexigens]|nr:hypothetical protein [Chromohalobacter salexigens]